MLTDFCVEAHCLIDSHHGRYIPKMFAEHFDWSYWNVDHLREERESLLAGPDDEWYWESWDTVLLEAYHDEYHLWQDDDLFAVVYRDDN